MRMIFKKCLLYSESLQSALLFKECAPDLIILIPVIFPLIKYMVDVIFGHILNRLRSFDRNICGLEALSSKLPFSVGNKTSQRR
jgi:hypothetical protein